VNSYRLIFDASTVRYPTWQWVSPWLAAALLGLVLVRFPHIYGARPRYFRTFGVLLCVVGCLAAVGIEIASRSQRNRIVGALTSGRFRVVEGRITNFHPGSTDSHPPEEFDVGTHHYRYAPAEALYGFNRVAGGGGPLRAGLSVRIADVEGVIARLEIADSASVR